MSVFSALGASTATRARNRNISHVCCMMAIARTPTGFYTGDPCQTVESKIEEIKIFMPQFDGKDQRSDLEPQDKDIKPFWKGLPKYRTRKNKE